MTIHNITKPKLVVIGCSFSDRTRVTHCYGDYLAELLGLEYIHLAKGGSSNDRIWRVLTKHIIDGTLTSNDIIVVQYTDIHRREFSSYGHNYSPYTTGPIEKYQSSYKKDDTYFVSHYKIDSHVWQANDSDREMHKVYQKTCSVQEFDFDYFYTRHRQFEALYQIHNIKLILFWTMYTNLSPFVVIGDYGRRNMLLQSSYTSKLNKKDIDSLVLGYNGGDPKIWDESHLNDTGHRFTAERAAEHIRNKGLL